MVFTLFSWAKNSSKMLEVLWVVFIRVEWDLPSKWVIHTSFIFDDRLEWDCFIQADEHALIMPNKRTANIIVPYSVVLTLQCPHFQSAECIEKLSCMLLARFRRICTTWRIERWYKQAHFGGNILQKCCKWDKQKSNNWWLQMRDGNFALFFIISLFIFKWC